MVLSGLVWSHLSLSGLVWSGLVWSGQAWSGLVWSGLVWSNLKKSGVWQYRDIQTLTDWDVGILGSRHTRIMRLRRREGS